MCLFNLEHYDCVLTEAAKCCAVLEKKYKSNLTSRAHRQLIPQCAERILAKKDGSDTAEAQVILNKYRAGGTEPIKPEKKLIFADYLKDLEPGNWQSFLQQDGLDINPYRLGLFLRETWKEKKNRFSLKHTGETEERETVTRVETIIELILNSFTPERTKLESSMQALVDEIRDKKKQYQEAEIRKEVLDLWAGRNWLELDAYLQTIEKQGYPGEFILFISEKEAEVQEGKKWLEIKDRYVECLSRVAEKDLDMIIDELTTWEQDLQFLLSNKDKWGKKEDELLLEALTGELYQNILGLLQTITNPEEQYQKIITRENQLVLIQYQPPREWQQYKVQLLHNLSKHYAKALEDILEQEEDMAILRQKLEELEEKDKKIHLPENIAAIDLAGQRLNKLEEYSHTLIRYLTLENPFDLQFQTGRLPDLAGEIKKMEPFISKWAVFKRLQAEFKESQGIIEQTVQFIEKIDGMLGKIIEESRKVLRNDLKLDIGRFREPFHDIEIGIAGLADHRGNVRFLKPLQDLLEILNRKLFSPREDNIDMENEYAGHDFYQRVDGLVKSGDRLKESLSELNNQAIIEPVELLEGLMRIITDNLAGDFILTVRGQKEIVEIIIRLKQKVYDLIDSVLSPITKVLLPFIPLVPKEKLEGYSGQLRELKKKIPETGSGNDYSGYEELSLPFEQQVQDIIAMIHVQQSIHRQDFAGAAKCVKENVETRVALKDHMLACIYYYEHLDNKEWEEDHWLDFFTQFGYQLSNEKADKREGILRKYEELFQANLPKITPRDLFDHFKIFKLYLQESPLFPYLTFITDQGTAGDLVVTIKKRKNAQKVFPLFHQYTIDNQLWEKYVRLYRACDRELLTHFNANPLKIVHDSLAGKFMELKKKYIAECALSFAEIEAFAQLIPEEEEFRFHRDNHKKLLELFQCFQDVTQAFQQFENKDIWQDIHFKITLNELEGKCNIFSGEFSGIRETLKWLDLITHLRNLYNQGRKIIEAFAWKNNRYTFEELAILETYDRKNSMDYSEKLKTLLYKFLQLREDFKKEWDELQPRYKSLKEVFDDEYFKPVFNNWRKSELWMMWQSQHLPGPTNFDGFFAMLRQILENHIAYVNAQEKDDKAKCRDSGHTDPYIILMEEKEKKENHLLFFKSKEDAHSRNIPLLVYRHGDKFNPDTSVEKQIEVFKRKMIFNRKGRTPFDIPGLTEQWFPELTITRELIPMGTRVKVKYDRFLTNKEDPDRFEEIILETRDNNSPDQHHIRGLEQHDMIFELRIKEYHTKTGN